MRRDRGAIYKNLRGLIAKRQRIWIFPDLISNGKSYGPGPQWVARLGTWWASSDADKGCGDALPT
jgi:hypothetical protein